MRLSRIHSSDACAAGAGVVAAAAQARADASQQHRAAPRRLRHQPGAHGRRLRRVERRRAAWCSRSPAAPATATACASGWSSTSATRTGTSAFSISASPPSNRATATSTTSIPARRMNEEVVEAVEGEARRQGSKIEVSLTQPAEEDGRARQRRALPEPAPAGDHRRGARRTARFSPPTSTRAPAPARRATRPPPRSAARCRSASDSPLRSGVRHWPVSVGYFEPDEGDGRGRARRGAAELSDELHALRERRDQRSRHGLWRLRLVRLAQGRSSRSTQPDCASR